ncbi:MULTISPECIES: Na+/H+ antiporter subunit E [Streptomyces]|uniref:Na(+)/H(+) antiporter subunit E n=1 Tax=Streptomyces rubrolavendulae TaxID=285473 RepID=A0A1D8G9Q5_9ACTN|nr:MULTISPECIES: Na+/H+ antiporter subunit E [Streptomyces]AOT62171.1 Na(+)/H(+) antiporter subunit E [Streptomyces rubrolavendulae]UQS29848.1 Na+/H+ antiporter subunit E [Streptomyces fradiae]
MTRRFTRRAARLRRAAAVCGRAVPFLLYYGRYFLHANAVVAWEIVSPGSRLAPVITRLPLRSRTPWEIAALAHLVSLAPGTLVLEARTAPPELLVHGMHAEDPRRFLATLRDLEDRLLAVVRPAEAGRGAP